MLNLSINVNQTRYFSGLHLVTPSGKNSEQNWLHFTYITDDVGDGVTSVNFPPFAEHAQSDVDMRQRFLVRVIQRRFCQLLIKDKDKSNDHASEFRAFFQWLSRVITPLRLLCTDIGLKFSDQWEAKPTAIAPCTRDFSRALSKLQVIARNSVCFVKSFTLPVIGQSNFFGIPYSTVNWTSFYRASVFVKESVKCNTRPCWWWTSEGLLFPQPRFLQLRKSKKKMFNMRVTKPKLNSCYFNWARSQSSSC